MLEHLPFLKTRPRFPWFLTLAFVLCIGLLGGEVFAFLSTMRNLDHSREAITDDVNALREVESFKAKFVGAEDGFRGFVVSGDTPVLEPFYRLMGDYKSDIHRMAALPDMQDSHAADLLPLVEQRLAQMAAVIGVRQKEGLDGVLAEAQPGDGRAQSADALTLMQGMEDGVNQKLETRRREASRVSLYGLTFMLVSGLLGVSGLVAFYLLTRKYFFAQNLSENELRQRESEFRAIFDVAAVGIVECLVDTGGIVQVNSKLSALLGYPASELQRMSLFQLLHGDTAVEDREGFHRQLTSSAYGPWVVERRCLRRDGTAVWVRASFDLIPVVPGEPAKAVGIVEAIDDRKRIEQTMQDNAAILRAISEDSRDLICVKGVDGQLIMANAAFLEFLGKRREEVLGLNEIDFLENPVQAKHIREIDRRVMLERASEHVEEDITVNGQTHTFLSSKVPYMDQEDKVIGVVNIARDITERKAQEKELLHSRNRLASDVHERSKQLASLSRHLIRVSEEEKGKLARELHDELGSALAAISMDMGWVLNQLRPINPEIASRQERALQGVRDTLDLKRRLVDGLRPLTLEHFGLDFALRAHCEAFAQSSRIQVEVRAPEKLPSVDSVTGLALFRMVQECLTNVSKHAQATRVRVSLDVQPDKMVVRVEDDGKGLPQAVAKAPETYGLVSMRERVAAVGGSISIGDSVEYHGVMVEAVVPLPPGASGGAEVTAFPEAANTAAAGPARREAGQGEGGTAIRPARLKVS